MVVSTQLCEIDSKEKSLLYSKTQIQVASGGLENDKDGFAEPSRLCSLYDDQTEVMTTLSLRFDNPVPYRCHCVHVQPSDGVK